MTQASIREQLEPIADQVTSEPAATRNAFFDPSDYIESVMNSLRLRQILASNLAWSLDNQIIGAAQSLYYEIVRDLAETRDTPMSTQEQLQHVVDSFRGTLNNEAYFGNGNARKLTMLLAIQPAWHDLAMLTATAAGFHSFEIRSIDTMIRTATVGETRQAVKDNLRELAKFEAERNSTKDNVVDPDTIYAELIKGSATAQQEFIERRKRLAPAISAIVGTAQMHTSMGSFTFGDLDSRTKLSIVQGQQRKNADARMQMARFLAPGEFATLVGESYAYDGALKRVIDRLAREVMAN